MSLHICHAQKVVLWVAAGSNALKIAPGRLAAPFAVEQIVLDNAMSLFAAASAKAQDVLHNAQE